jgi:hypothetical protein
MLSGSFVTMTWRILGSRTRPLNMEDILEYTKQATLDSRHRVLLELGG